MDRSERFMRQPIKEKVKGFKRQPTVWVKVKEHRDFQTYECGCKESGTDPDKEDGPVLKDTDLAKVDVYACGAFL